MTLVNREMHLGSFHAIVGRYGNEHVRWRLVVGWPSLGVWIDNRGVTLDVGRRRFSWWQPKGWQLFHVRRLPLHWWGRAEATRNPNVHTRSDPS